MKSYLYSPYDLAFIFQYHSLDIVRIIEILEDIYRYDNAFIQSGYRRNQKKFMFDVMDKLNYLNNQEQFELERADVDKDLADLGLASDSDIQGSEEAFHLAFKELRLRILYINKNGYAKVKLKTLLLKLGYKKRSPAIINYIIDCLLFYHLSVSMRNNAPCRLDKISLDEDIIFRVV